MHTRSDQNVELVRQAAAGLVAARPAFAGLIRFYAAIFAAQEESCPSLRLDPHGYTLESAAARMAARAPLVPVAQMRFDPRAAGALLTELCRLAVDCRSELSGPAEVLREHAAEIPPLWKGFLCGEDNRVGKAAADWGIAPGALSFFLYHSLRPAFSRLARDLAAVLPADAGGDGGSCPICGSAPALACLESEGRRFLFCGFCWHRHPADRPSCPFCATREPGRLSYLYSEAEKEYRIDLCDACRRYIKTVDVRNLKRRFYPPLEQIASLHLDLKASEAGYASPRPTAPPP